jgi:hypothetical protein
VAAAPGCVPRCDPLTNATLSRPSGRVPLCHFLGHCDRTRITSQAVARPLPMVSVLRRLVRQQRQPPAARSFGLARTGLDPCRGPGSRRTPRPAGFPVGVLPPAAPPVSGRSSARSRLGHGRQMAGRRAAKRPGGFNGLGICCPSW